MDETGFFAQIPQHEVDCRGQPVKMPLFYRRSRMLQAGVAMHTAQVEPLLELPAPGGITTVTLPPSVLAALPDADLPAPRGGATIGPRGIGGQGFRHRAQPS